ncbi:predicted protein [Streptomyces sp. C]|nr:predicted protein [Streptomyces sp. C]
MTGHTGRDHLGPITPTDGGEEPSLTSPLPRNVLSLDTPDGAGTAPLSLPSADLLARAQVGWEHFLLGMGSELPDE